MLVELNRIAESEEEHSSPWGTGCASPVLPPELVGDCSAEFLPWYLQLSPAKVETDSVGLGSVLWEENIPRGLDKPS